MSESGRPAPEGSTPQPAPVIAIIGAPGSGKSTVGPLLAVSDYKFWESATSRLLTISLIFLLWGSTQHYADFASQICLFTGKSSLKKADFEEAADNLERIILKGCGLTPPPRG